MGTDQSVGHDARLNEGKVPVIVDLPSHSPLRGLGHRPTLVVFLRSFGCTFCRQAMADVAAIKRQLDAAGTGVAIVHGSPAEDADAWFSKYGLSGIVRVSDPALDHYRAFGLGRTGVEALIDPKVWAKGAVCAFEHGFGAQPAELMRQLPGVFLLQGNAILAEFRHRSPSDRPDYLALLRNGAPTPVR